LNLGKKKIRIEMEDEEGGRYNLSLEGSISKTKILKLYEFMNMVDGKTRNYDVGTPENGELYSRSNSKIEENRPVSVGDKIWSIVANKFRLTAFTSSDILEMYEAEYVEPIQLSIISTYLSRYSEKGRLTRLKKGKEWVYRMGSKVSDTTLFRRDQPFDPSEMSPNIEKSTEVN
jgi:hypothetical protein